MTLLDEIKAKCPPELLAGREHGAIAESVSQDRTAVVSRLGGIGAVVETLGVVDGPAVLDAIDSLRASNPAVRWGWVLLERAELDFGSAVTRQLIDSLTAGGVMTADQANKLKALAVVPAPVTTQDVIAAMEGM